MMRALGAKLVGALRRLNGVTGGQWPVFLGVVVVFAMLAQMAFSNQYVQCVWTNECVWVQRGKMTTAESELKVSVKNMTTARDKNGRTLLDGINAVASGEEAKELMYIAIHESRGQFGAAESGGKGPGRCAFQITGDDTFQTAANIMGVPVAQLKANIMTDAAMCAAAGMAVLRAHAKRSAALGLKGGGSVTGQGAVCLYGSQVYYSNKSGKGVVRYNAGSGQGQTFFTWGQCPAYVEIQAIKTLLNGGSVTMTAEQDSTKITYSVGTFKDDAGNEFGYELTCVDYSETLARALANASKAYKATAISTFRDTYVDGITSDNLNKSEDPHDDIKERKCLRRVLSDYFNNVLDLLSKIDSNSISAFIQKEIKLLVQSIIEKACTWAAAAINSALSSVCIPIPNLSFGFSLPSLESKTCSGVSAADLFKVTSDYSSSGGSLSVSTSSLLPPAMPMNLSGMGVPAEANMPAARGMTTTTTGTGPELSITIEPVF